MEETKIKDIVTDLDKLGEISDYIDTKKDGEQMREVILCLKKTMEDKNLLSLSAPQIGYNVRIFCVKDKKGIHSFVNPMIKKANHLMFSRESDESIPGKEFIHPRSEQVVVNYQTPMGDFKATTVVGYSSYVFQRMIDHLNGVLISDIGLEIDDQWDQASEEEREEVLKAYSESLDLMNKKLDEDIQANEELKKQKKAIEFEHALIAGDITVEKRELTKEEINQVKDKISDLDINK